MTMNHVDLVENPIPKKITIMIYIKLNSADHIVRIGMEIKKIKKRLRYNRELSKEK